MTQCPRVKARIECLEGTREYPYSEALYGLPQYNDPGHKEPQPDHVCGLQGFDSYLGDRCPGCDYSPSLQEMQDEFAVDPSEKAVYGSSLSNSNESRSNTMSSEDMCGYCGDEGHWDDDCPELEEEGFEYNITDFLGKLETFLVDELDEECRGNVFLSETGDDQVAINILVGAPFEGSGLEVDCSQINIIIAPTDREFLGSEGVSIDDSVEGSFESDEVVEQSEKHSWFDAAMRIFRND